MTSFEISQLAMLDYLNVLYSKKMVIFNQKHSAKVSHARVRSGGQFENGRIDCEVCSLPNWYGQVILQYNIIVSMLIKAEVRN